MKAIYYILILIFVAGCTSNNEYTIYGTIEGETSEEWIYLVKFMEEDPSVDSTRIINGQFSFKGIAEFPEVYGIHYHPSRLVGICPIFLEPSKLKVTIDNENWEMGSTVSGGLINNQYTELMNTRMNNFLSEIMAINKKLSTATNDEKELLRVRLNMLSEQDFSFTMNFIKSNTDSPISIFLLSYYFFEFPSEELEVLLNSFSEEIKNTSIYKSISEAHEIQVELSNRTPAYEYAESLKPIDVNFKENSVIETLTKLNPNKNLFIDIWGTWCKPCRKEFPHSKRLWQEFGNDVTFIYVCINSNEEEWKNLVREEELKGQHFLINNELVDKLLAELNIQMQGIPHYLIIDKNGKLVNSNAPKPSSKEIVKILKIL